MGRWLSCDNVNCQYNREVYLYPWSESPLDHACIKGGLKIGKNGMCKDMVIKDVSTMDVGKRDYDEEEEDDADAG